jgi:ubiquitin-protein ligase
MTSFLQNNWTPKYTIKGILQHILDLLHYPDIVLNEFEQVALADAIED